MGLEKRKDLYKLWLYVRGVGIMGNVATAFTIYRHGVIQQMKLNGMIWAAFKAPLVKSYEVYGTYI